LQTFKTIPKKAFIFSLHFDMLGNTLQFVIFL
jgi:hypothetical protein